MAPFNTPVMINFPGMKKILIEMKLSVNWILQFYKDEETNENEFNLLDLNKVKKGERKSL